MTKEEADEILARNEIIDHSEDITPVSRPPMPTLTRERVADAIYLEMFDQGFGSSEALDVAEGATDRLRLGVGKVSARDRIFFDLRKEQSFLPSIDLKKIRSRNGSDPVLRDPSVVDTIVLHQTAIEYGVTSRAAKESGGNTELARARRSLRTACHALAFRNGYFAVPYPLRTYVNHAGYLNATSLGLEIEGRYPGLIDDPSTVAREDLRTTWGGKPSVLDDMTLDCAKAALAWLVNEARSEGMPISKITAHRISSNNRRNDPGEEIWKMVALDFGVAVLGLVPVREPLQDRGRPIPVQWDPYGIGDY